MFSKKQGYVIIDCNTSKLDYQSILFLLEYSSVLCITLTESAALPLHKAYRNTMTLLSRVGRYDIPVVISDQAAPTLVHICGKFRHKVTVVCLGALTNLARALQCDGGFERCVKRVVCLGDGFDGAALSADWNITADKEAARSVFLSSLPIVLLPSSLDCMIPITTYLNIREGTNGLISRLFNLYEEALLKASSKESRRSVCLQKTVAALVALQPTLITQTSLVNFKHEDPDHTLDSTWSSLTHYNDLSLNSASSKGSYSSEVFKTLNRRENVLVVQKIDKSGVVNCYRHIYLIGAKARVPYSLM